MTSLGTTKSNTMTEIERENEGESDHSAYACPSEHKTLVFFYVTTEVHFLKTILTSDRELNED